MKERRIEGLQAIGLEATPQRVDEILEKTDLGNQQHRHLMELNDFAFTESEIKKARQAIDDVIFPRHHPKTPLPIPRQ